MGLYIKILWIRNLQEIDKFRSKLASSTLDKHSSVDKHNSLNKQKHYFATESVHYEFTLFL
jgi:hypothetical protein